MLKIEKTYLNLSDDYLFKKIASRKNELKKKYDDVIDLSIRKK